jgi:hypothetical protein
VETGTPDSHDRRHYLGSGRDDRLIGTNGADSIDGRAGTIT